MSAECEHVWIQDQTIRGQRCEKCHVTELEFLRDRAERLEQQLGDILAVIHRDGGHYTTERGVERSVEDARQKWADLVKGRASDLKRAGDIIDKQRTEIARLKKYEQDHPTLDERKWQAEKKLMVDGYAELQTVLRQWKCPSCAGRGNYPTIALYDGLQTHKTEFIRCDACAGTGLHPIARAALGEKGGA